MHLSAHAPRGGEDRVRKGRVGDPRKSKRQWLKRLRPLGLSLLELTRDDMESYLTQITNAGGTEEQFR